MHKLVQISAALALASGLAACNTLAGQQQTGALAGALAGGAAGAVIGGSTTLGHPAGVLVGGALGAAGGAILGSAAATASANNAPPAVAAAPIQAPSYAGAPPDGPRVITGQDIPANAPLRYSAYADTSRPDLSDARWMHFSPAPPRAAWGPPPYARRDWAQYDQRGPYASNWRDCQRVVYDYNGNPVCRF